MDTNLQVLKSEFLANSFLFREEFWMLQNAVDPLIHAHTVIVSKGRKSCSPESRATKEEI